MDEKKKRVIAVFLVAVVAVMAGIQFYPTSAPTPGLPSTDVTPQVPAAVAPDGVSMDLGGPHAEGNPTVAPVSPVDSLPMPAAAEGSGAVTPDVATPSPQPEVAMASAPTSTADGSGDPINTLLSRQQVGDIETRIEKQRADRRRAQAEAESAEAQARLAAAKARAEAAYIEANPERYAQQALKGAAGGGGFDATSLPPLTPASALGGFGAIPSGGSGTPSLRMISGEGKERYAVLLVDGLAVVAHSGTTAGGYLVKSIDEHSVTLERDGKRSTIGFAIPAARAMQANQRPAGGTSNVQPQPRVAQPADSSSTSITANPDLQAGGGQVPF